MTETPSEYLPTTWAERHLRKAIQMALAEMDDLNPDNARQILKKVLEHTDPLFLEAQPNVR